MLKPISVAAAIMAAGLSVTAASAEELIEQWRVTGFDLPESVSWDPEARAFYVSNLGTDPFSKDGNGFISKLDEEGKVVDMHWATGLNAPKGTEVADGRLWTTDIDEIVEIDTASGEIVNRYTAPGATFLNDLARAPDGSVYVADTMKNTLYRLKDGVVEAWLQAPELNGPNGLTVIDGDLVVAALGDITNGFENMPPGTVLRVDLETKAITAFNEQAPAPGGNFDGIEPDGSGGVTLTANPQGKLIALRPDAAPVEVASLRPGSADHEYVAELALFLIPQMQENEVVAYRRPA